MGVEPWETNDAMTYQNTPTTPWEQASRFACGFVIAKIECTDKYKRSDTPFTKYLYLVMASNKKCKILTGDEVGACIVQGCDVTPDGKGNFELKNRGKFSCDFLNATLFDIGNSCSPFCERHFILCTEGCAPIPLDTSKIRVSKDIPTVKVNLDVRMDKNKLCDYLWNFTHSNDGKRTIRSALEKGEKSWSNAHGKK